MRIYIDEAGGFVVPPNRLHRFSLVLALIVPSNIEAELFYEFLRLRDGWPVQDIEIKGSSIDESQAAQVIDLASRYDVLVQFVALDMATHIKTVVDDFRLRQAAEVTAHLTEAHHTNLVSKFEDLAAAVREMPNQLFLQAFLTMHLILEVIEEATLYFVQRQPTELGDIAWTIDRKDRTITEMENTWTILILPMSESYFARKPLKALSGADYSHFYARYSTTIEAADQKLKRHLNWMRETYGMRPLSPGENVFDAKLLLSDQREFLDSRNSLGLQLADMLATILCRALNNHLQFPGWKDFGRLLVRRRQPGSPFLRLGAATNAEPVIGGHAARVCRTLNARAKSMLIDDSG
jgi:hypothetical protein